MGETNLSPDRPPPPFTTPRTLSCLSLPRQPPTNRRPDPLLSPPSLSIPGLSRPFTLCVGVERTS